MLRKAPWLFLVTFVILILFLPGYSKLQELRQKNRELEARIAAARKENTELREEKKKLENDVVYLEEVARDKMGVARKGEIIYRIVPEEKN